MTTATVRVPYAEYKNKFEGFEIKKSDYNADDKTIEITISEKIYAKLKDKKNAAIAYNKIKGVVWLPQMQNLSKKFILGGSDKYAQWIEINADELKKFNYYDKFKKAIETIKCYGI